MVMKLTLEQQQLVLDHRGYVCQIAYNIWRWAHVPARHLEDMKGEAELALCIAVTNYKDTRKPLTALLSETIKYALFQYLKKTFKGGVISACDVSEETKYQLDPPCYDEEEKSNDLLIELLNTLTPKQREVIELRYGLSGKLPMPHVKINNELGFKQSADKEHAALRKMRNLYERINKDAAA